jgi:hypothetical protein
MCESNGAVSEVVSAGEMCVVMETSGQGWFEWEISHLQHVSKLPLAPSVTEPVVHRGGRGAGGAVWNHLVGSSD